MAHHRDSTQTLLKRIEENTKNINLNVDTLEVNTDGLETLQTTANNATLRDINNTGAIGDGSSNATSVSLGYDRSNGQGRAILVDASGNQSVNVVSGGDISTKLQTISDATVRGISNTNQIGDGSNNATSVVMGYDRSGGKARALLVDGDAHLQVDVLGGAFSATGLATETTLSNAEAHLGTIDTNIASVKTAVELLDNAVDGNYLNVNVNLAGNDADTNSGNKSANSQRVVIATDDINLSSIKTDMTNAEAHLGTIETNTTNGEAHLGTIETNTTNSEAHLGTIDTNIASIKTAVELIDNAVDSNALNTNLQIQGNDVDSNSGNKSANSQRVVIATDDVNLSSIKTDMTNAEAHLGTIDTNIGSIKTAVELLDNAVDGNNLNVNLNIAGNDVDSNSGNKSANSQRVVIATDDVNLSAIKTAVEAIDDAVDGQSLNVNLNIAGNDVDSNSGNKSANSQRVVIATDDVNISQIASAQTLTTTQLHNNTSISGSGGSDTHSTVFTFTSNPRSITIFASDASGSGSISGSQIQISPMVSMDNSNFFDLSTALASGGGSANQIIKSEMLREAIVVIENCRFKFLKVKITNNAGGAINFDSFVCF